MNIENVEQMIVYFPRAMKFYSFKNTTEDIVIIGKIFELLQNDEYAKENLVDIDYYFRQKAHDDMLKKIRENKND